MLWCCRSSLVGLGLSLAAPARAASTPKGWQCKAQLKFLGLYILLEGFNKLLGKAYDKYVIDHCEYQWNALAHF